MSKSTKSSKRAKMLKLKNYRSVAKSVILKHLSIIIIKMYKSTNLLSVMTTVFAYVLKK